MNIQSRTVFKIWELVLGWYNKLNWNQHLYTLVNFQSIVRSQDNARSDRNRSQVKIVINYPNSHAGPIQISYFHYWWLYTHKYSNESLPSRKREQKTVDFSDCENFLLNETIFPVMFKWKLERSFEFRITSNTEVKSLSVISFLQISLVIRVLYSYFKYSPLLI